MEYITANETADIWQISSRRVRKLCEEGRVKGAIQKANLWLIPTSSPKPQELPRGRKGVSTKKLGKKCEYGNS